MAGGGQFFERFRAEVAKYADGVHNLAPPAAAKDVAALPAELASFYRSWNGAELFVDAIVIRPAGEVDGEDGLLIFGETGTGDRLALDAAGRVLRIEEDTGEALVEGTSFARWIEASVVADGVLYDREGEFKDDVFDEAGEDMTPVVVEKREKKALKIDPDAPAPAWRLARALEQQGRRRQALDLLARLCDRWPTFGWAWFDRGKLLRAEGQLAEAEAAFARAVDADPAYEHAGFFAAHAARAAAARNDDAARARHAARALELDPEVGRTQKQAARRLLDEADATDPTEAAREAAELAAAVMPRDVEVLDLLRRVKG